MTAVDANYPAVAVLGLVVMLDVRRDTFSSTDADEEAVRESTLRYVRRAREAEREQSRQSSERAGLMAPCT